MKLANKIISIIGISVLLVSIIICVVFYSESKKAAILSGEEKALVLVKTFDSTLSGNESPQDLQQSLNRIVNSKLEVLEFNIYKIDKETKAIASTDPSTIGKIADQEDITAAKENRTITIIDNNVVDVTTPLHTDGKISYVAGIQFDIADELEASNQILLILSIVTLILLVLVMLMVWYLVTKFLTNSLKVFVRYSELIASGDLRVDIEALNNNRKDEIGILSRSFYQMVLNLKNTLSQISVSSSQLADHANQISLVTTITGKKEREIAISIEEIAQSSKAQTTSIGENSLAIDEVAKGIGQISMSTEDVSVASSSSLLQAEKGKQIIEDTQSIMEDLVSQSKDSVKSIQQLGDMTKEINEIIVLISGIASQTNLLSLNASIEAARAGEQGRGFAVVANEVKKLAEKSQMASDSVSEMIHSIQNGTDAVIVQINQSSEKTEEGLIAVRNAGKSFENITSEIDTVNNQIINVSAVVEEISASSEEIAATIQILVKNAEHSSGQASQVAEATISSMAAMQELLTSTRDLTKLSEDLDQLVGNFKL